MPSSWPSNAASCRFRLTASSWSMIPAIWPPLPSDPDQGAAARSLPLVLLLPAAEAPVGTAREAAASADGCRPNGRAGSAWDDEVSPSQTQGGEEGAASAAAAATAAGWFGGRGEEEEGKGRGLELLTETEEPLAGCEVEDEEEERLTPAPEECGRTVETAGDSAAAKAGELR